MTLNRLQRYYGRTAAPVRHQLTLGDELDQLFQQFFGQAAPRFELGSGERVPAVDLYENKDSLVVKVELPGLKKEDITIALDEGILTVTGERKAESKQETATLRRRERAVGQFGRSLRLPYPVDPDKVKATYIDGVLTVTLPKAEEAKPKQIAVDTN